MGMTRNPKPYCDELHALRAYLDAHAVQLTDEVSDVGDPADRANQQRDIAVKIGLATHEAIIRREIDAALERINAGTFATCERCHAVIGARRLNALPYTRYCVRCERRIEQVGTS